MSLSLPSALATSGPRLRDNGVSILPIMAGGKAPGAFMSGAWRAEHGWQRWCERLPSKFEMQIWERWPDAGVGAALGTAGAPKGYILAAADIDTEDSAIAAAILSVIPPSPVRKVGRKGQTLFYLAREAVVNRSFNLHGERVLDLLAHGRQTVLPPTAHPDCPHCHAKGTVNPATLSCSECGADGLRYRWTTPDTLENYAIADLPVLDDDVADKLAEVLAPFGYVAAPVLGAAGSDTLGIENPHRALNDAALANLAAWVPALQLYRCFQVGGHYKAVAHWRPSSSGRPTAQRATNLAISPEGIKDCGEQKGYTPIDLVMCACGADLDTAFRWLQERVAPQKPVILNLTPPKAAPVAEEAAAPAAERPRGNLTFMTSLAAPADDVEHVVEEVVEFGPSGVLPPDICRPAGLLGEIVDWIVASAETPSPQLALGAAVNLMGAISGRRFESPTRARTNFYSVGVAVTGFGKGHAPACCGRLARAAGLQRFIGPGDVKSDSAIRKLLEVKPAVALFMDEFGGYMSKILDRRAASHDRRVRDLLLTLFSVANDVYTGSEGATERAVEIMNPNLCVHGVSTPRDLWGAFSSASAEDGLLPRFLVFDVGSEARPEIVEPTADAAEPPRDLIKKLQAFMDVRPAGNLNGLAGGVNKPIRAEWGPGAGEWFKAYRTALREEALDIGGMREIVLSRQGEHVIKLALLYAVGCEPAKPVITLAALEWAQVVAETSSTALLQAIEGRIADGDRQREYLLVLRLIRENGAEGVTEGGLARAIRGQFDKRRFDDILAQLSQAGEVERKMTGAPLTSKLVATARRAA